MNEPPQYPTPPPYHINQNYDHSYIDNHNQPPLYDDDYNYDTNYYPNNNYNSRIDPNENDPYDNHPPPHKNDGGFPPYREEKYYMSMWVHYSRYIPHMNLPFNRVNDTFNPLSSVYQEVSSSVN